MTSVLAARTDDKSPFRRLVSDRQGLCCRATVDGRTAAAH